MINLIRDIDLIRYGLKNERAHIMCACVGGGEYSSDNQSYLAKFFVYILAVFDRISAGAEYLPKYFCRNTICSSFLIANLPKFGGKIQNSQIVVV